MRRTVYAHETFAGPNIRNEVTLVDDTAIWKQILLHTG